MSEQIIRCWMRQISRLNVTAEQSVTQSAFIQAQSGSRCCAESRCLLADTEMPKYLNRFLLWKYSTANTCSSDNWFAISTKPVSYSLPSNQTTGTQVSHKTGNICHNDCRAKGLKAMLRREKNTHFLSLKAHKHTLALEVFTPETASYSTETLIK